MGLLSVPLKVRGKLCGTCNMFIGMIEQDSHFIEKMNEYLNKETK